MRRLYIHGEITDETFSRFSKKLAKLVQASPSQPIVVELSSEGGSSYAALAIYGRIVSCPAPIHVHAYGPILSAATIILAAGTKRSVAPESWFMVHEDSGDIEGETSFVVKKAKQMLIEEKQWASILARHSLLSASEWFKLSKESTYFTAEECVKVGVADNILKYSKGVK